MNQRICAPNAERRPRLHSHITEQRLDSTSYKYANRLTTDIKHLFTMQQSRCYESSSKNLAAFHRWRSAIRLAEDILGRKIKIGAGDEPVHHLEEWSDDEVIQSFELGSSGQREFASCVWGESRTVMGRVGTLALPAPSAEMVRAGASLPPARAARPSAQAGRIRAPKRVRVPLRALMTRPQALPRVRRTRTAPVTVSRVRCARTATPFATMATAMDPRARAR